jgi:hypothetical protein
VGVGELEGVRGLEGELEGVRGGMRGGPSACGVVGS